MAGLSIGRMHNNIQERISNTDKFAHLGVFSSGWIVPMMNSTRDQSYAFIQKNADIVSRNLTSFLISEGGNEGIAWKNGQIMLEKLNELKIINACSEYPGWHTTLAWRNNLVNFVQVLFK